MKENSRSIKVIVPGRFHGLNDFIDANRYGSRAGNGMKRKDQRTICRYIPKGVKFDCVVMIYRFFEPNARRDKDNISGYFRKVFQDALIQQKVIPNDGWKNIADYKDEFYIDKNNPRVEVEIYEVCANERQHPVVQKPM